MQVIINIFFFAVLIFIIYKIIQIIKIKDSDKLMLQFIKITNELKSDQNKVVDVIVKSVDKLNKSIYNLTHIKQSADNLHKINSSFNSLNTQYNEHLKNSKDITNTLKHKIVDLNRNISKLNNLQKDLIKNKK